MRGPLTTVLLGAIAVTLISATTAWAVKTNLSEPAAVLSDGGASLSLNDSRAFPSLDARLAAIGYPLPPGAAVYLAQVVRDASGRVVRLVEHEAGAGASSGGFWPASSIKVLAALGALDFLHSLGFSGAAVVKADAGWTATVRELADLAVDESSNDAYDQLVQIAGFDRLNDVFLSPANGFPATVIQRSYSGIDIRSSPALTITENGRTVTVPPRLSTADYPCPDEGNCSNLHELADSVQRVVLYDDLPPAKRLPFARADIAALADDLLASDGFIEPGAVRALGKLALVYDKPGWVTGLDCVDAGVVVDLASGNRFVLAVTVPDRGVACEDLADIAENVLKVVAG